MKQTKKKQLSLSVKLGDRCPRGKAHATLRLAMSLVSIGALAACSGGGESRDGGPGVGPTESINARSVRAYVNAQIPGGISKLQVPANDRAIPVPPAPQAYPGRFDLTEPKRYLGKLLFHDPIRTQRVNVNKGQPLDFPKATTFGRTIGCP